MAGLSHLEQFQNDTLLGLIDESVRNAQPTTADRFLPNRNVYSNTFAYDVIKNTQHIAAMIGYGAEPPVVDRDAVASMHGEIAKVGLKYIATEEELLALNQARNDGERAAMVDRLTVKALDLAQAIQRRFDVMKSEAIFKGQVSHNKNGVKVSVDFGIPANHKEALTSPNDWEDTSRDVIADLLGWVATYEATNGQAPDAILVSREVFGLLAKNANLIAEAGRPAGSLRASEADIQAVLAANGLPAVQIVNNRSVTVKDIYTGAMETIEFMPANRVVFASEGLGDFLVGPTVENNFQPGIFVDAYDNKEPVQSILRAVAAGFPAVANPGLLFHADVYTP